MNRTRWNQDSKCGVFFVSLTLIILVFSNALVAESISKPVIYLPSTIGGTNFETIAQGRTGSSNPFDEQVGITFTQDFSALAFNVTVESFTDPNGVGPAFLLNGLTNLGYWYQVGVSYDWPLYNGGYNSGFNMNYEVFDPYNNSIDPAVGGGLQNFDALIFSNDTVLLGLTFSSGNVLMTARDWQTGASALQSYPAYGNRFIGLQSKLANKSGYFTGLMTEHYHSYPYRGTGQPVVYTDTGTHLSSAWMWMDEWNTNTRETVFRSNTTLPVQLSTSTAYYFSSNGTAEVATAYGLITGLTPIAFPSILDGAEVIGEPGGQALVGLTLAGTETATVRFENLSILTSFKMYNVSISQSFLFNPGGIQNVFTIVLPTNLALGTYNMTIEVKSWQYWNYQAHEWIPLPPVSLNETLLVTNSPPATNPPSNPGSSPPPSGQGPSRSTDNTIFSPISFLAALRSTILPIIGGYAALGLLAVALLLRRERRRSRLYPILGLRFCTNCGREVGPETIICPHCNFSARSAITDQPSMPPKKEIPQAVG